MAKNVILHSKKKKALRLLQNNSYKEAEKLLLNLTRSSPRDVDTWFLLSAAAGEQGKFDDVITYCNKVLSIDKTHARAYSNIGNALASTGQPEEAISHYKRAIKYSPNDPDIYNNLGNIHYMMGNLDKAEKYLIMAIEMQPDNGQAHHNLANVLYASHRPGDAISHFNKAIQLDPALKKDSLLGLASIHTRLLAFDSAIEHLQQVLHIDRECTDAYLGLGITYRHLGKLDDAMSIYQKALELTPDHPELLSGKADILQCMDKPGQSYEIIQQLIERDQLTPSAIHVYARICDKYSKCPEVIQLTKQALTHPAIDVTSRKNLHHTLAHLYEQNKQYDAAFRHYERANTLGRLTFDRKKHTDEIGHLKRVFNKEQIGSLARASNNADKPVFIVGMPRSGTSLVEQIIACHPLAYGAGELNNINDIAGNIQKTLDTKTPYPECITSIPSSGLDQLATQYLNALNELSADANIVTDKMPSNFKHMGFIQLLFPHSRVIHCTRDPIDTCLSIYFQSFSDTHTYATDLSDIGHFYSTYRLLMEHWKEVLSLPVLEVSYEELVNNQEMVTRKIIAFCGLPWDKQCLSFHRSKRYTATASSDQVRKPIYTSSIKKWERYEPYIGELKKALSTRVSLCGYPGDG